MGRLNGKVAIVTGGARGQGEAEVRRFVSEGARVIISDILVDQGEALAADLGAEAAFIRHDVSQEADWAAVIEFTLARFGALNVLVNNAGIGQGVSISRHTVEDFERLFAVNQLGVFLGVKAAITPMVGAGGGSIINVSSGAGLRATKYMFAYAATKYAVTGMTACAALELASKGIRVNSIHPGPIATPMFQGSTDAAANDVIQATAMKRAGTADEVANVALFLASDESSYMTGAHLPVDGGWCL